MVYLARLRFLFAGSKAVLAQGFLRPDAGNGFYNLFIFISVRDSSFFILCTLCGGQYAVFASLQGFSFQLLWPNATQWNDTSIIFSLSLTMLFGVLLRYDF